VANLAYGCLAYAILGGQHYPLFARSPYLLHLLAVELGVVFGGFYYGPVVVPFI
jgi:hypothetical protein